MNTKNNSKRGFTIIEVVLVLAIAGLIFLIVFLAVPALQRSQRDTQRRNDAGRMLTLLGNYQSNNKGAFPSATGQDAFITNYVKGELNSPSSGSAYTFSWTRNANANYATDTDTMQIALGAKCDPGNSRASTSGAGGRNMAVIVPLEGGGAYCTDQ